MWMFGLLPNLWYKELDQRCEFLPFAIMICFFKMLWTGTDLLNGLDSLYAFTSSGETWMMVVL